MISDVIGEITDAAMPTVTMSAPVGVGGTFSGTIANADMRERTVFHRGRLENLMDLRDRIFGVDP